MPGVPGDLRDRNGSGELRAGRMGWGREQDPGWSRTRLIPCGSKSWQLFQTAAELHFSLLRPNFPWDVQEEPPKARGGAQGRVGTSAAQLAQHPGLSGRKRGNKWILFGIRLQHGPDE